MEEQKAKIFWQTGANFWQNAQNLTVPLERLDCPKWEIFGPKFVFLKVILWREENIPIGWTLGGHLLHPILK